MEHVLTICDLKENNLYIQFQNFKKKSPRKIKIVNFETLDWEKSVKMTEFDKSRIQSLTKIGYFLSPLKFLDLNRNIKSEPH